MCVTGQMPSGPPQWRVLLSHSWQPAPAPGFPGLADGLGSPLPLVALTLVRSRPPTGRSGVLRSDEGFAFSFSSLVALESLSLMRSYCLQKSAMTAVAGEEEVTPIRSKSPLTFPLQPPDLAGRLPERSPSRSGSCAPIGSRYTSPPPPPRGMHTFEGLLRAWNSTKPSNCC